LGPEGGRKWRKITQGRNSRTSCKMKNLLQENIWRINYKHYTHITFLFKWISVFINVMSIFLAFDETLWYIYQSYDQSQVAQKMKN
jgi:hypothetical protein